MALIRRGDKHYLIRSIRLEGGRVTSRYVASGDRAVALDRAFKALAPRRPDPRDLREQRRERREAERAALKARRQADRVRKRDEDLESKLKVLVGGAKAVADLAMRVSGFHKRRWSWRRKRGEDMAETRAALAELREKLGIGADAPLPTLAEVEAEQELRSSGGAVATVDEGEGHDRRDPDRHGAVAAESKCLAADPVRAIVEILVGKWSGDDVDRELLRRRYAVMLADLEGPNPGAVEKHLAERAMVCWLDTYVSDRLAISLDASLNFSPAEKNYFQRTRDRASRRYIETLKALALVRARAIPALRLTMAVRDGASGSSAAAVVEAGQ